MGSKIYNLNIYPRAQADFEDIFRYISVKLCNPTAAAFLIDEMEDSLDLGCKIRRCVRWFAVIWLKDKSLCKLIVEDYIVFLPE